jgi:hypothetical protein
MVVGVAAAMFSARAGFAESLNIFIDATTGKEAYQFGASGWVNASAPAVSAWDSMMTQAGVPSAGPGNPGSINDTNDFKLSSLTGVAGAGWYVPVGSDQTEAALVLSQFGTSGVSDVSDLLVFDGNPSGAYFYQAPTFVPSTTTVVNTAAPYASYGYVGGNLSGLSYNGEISDINGLTAELDYNYGFDHGTGSTPITNNIATDDIMGSFVDPITSGSVSVYAYDAGINGPGTITSNGTALDTTYYILTPDSASISPADLPPAAVPLPASVWTGFGLLGLAGAVKIMRVSRRGGVITDSEL